MKGSNWLIDAWLLFQIAHGKEGVTLSELSKKLGMSEKEIKERLEKYIKAGLVENCAMGNEIRYKISDTFRNFFPIEE